MDEMLNVLNSARKVIKKRIPKADILKKVTEPPLPVAQSLPHPLSIKVEPLSPPRLLNSDDNKINKDGDSCKYTTIL